jgi:hypothetical protein
MASLVFHHFSALPDPVRERIWDMAIRPDGPGAHIFTLFNLAFDQKSRVDHMDVQRGHKYEKSEDKEMGGTGRADSSGIRQAIMGVGQSLYLPRRQWPLGCM